MWLQDYEDSSLSSNAHTRGRRKNPLTENPSPKRISKSQESILAAVKRDCAAANLYTWHRRLGHLGNLMLKRLVRSTSVKGMAICDELSPDRHMQKLCHGKDGHRFSLPSRKI